MGGSDQPGEESLGALHEVLEGYVAAWNETDPTRRGELVRRWLAEDFAFSGPTGTFRGHRAIEDLIEAIRSRMPGAGVVMTGVETKGGDIQFAWQVRSAQGGVVMQGTDRVVVGDDGRLAAIEMTAGTPARSDP